MRLLSLWVFGAALVVTIVPGAAMDIRTGDRIVVEANEVIEDDLLAAGRIVDIKGAVTGDVIAFAESITIGGSVGGSVMTAGRTVTVEGPVAGTVRAAGQSLRFQASVGRNLLTAGETVDVAEPCRVGREAYLAGNVCHVAGATNGIRAAAGYLVIQDGVDGDVVAYVDDLELSPEAKVEGDLVYTSEAEAKIPPGAVAGEVEHRLPKKAAPTPRRFRPWGLLLWLASGFATGLVLALAMPRASRSITEAPLTRPGASLGWGALAFAATPVLAVIVCITVIGLPLGLIALVSWGIALYVGYIFAAMAVGRALLASALKGCRVSLVWCLLLGLVVLMLVKMIPVLGGFLILVAIIWGMGSMAIGLRRPPEPAATAPVPPPPPAEQEA